MAYGSSDVIAEYAESERLLTKKLDLAKKVLKKVQEELESKANFQLALEVMKVRAEIEKDE